MNSLNIGQPCPVKDRMHKVLGFKLFHKFPYGFLPVRLYGK